MNKYTYLLLATIVLILSYKFYYHYHQVVLIIWSVLTLLPSVFIVHCSWQCFYRAGQPTLAFSCVGVHKRMSFMSSSLLLQHVFFMLLELFVRWEVSGSTASVLWCVTSRICSKQHSAFLYNLFSTSFVNIQVLHPYSSTDTATAYKKSCFILSERSSFHMINNLSVAIHAFAMCMLTLLSVDEILLSRYVNSSKI